MNTTTENQLSDQEILNILQSDKCHCGKSKKPRMSHCTNCYYKLPPQMRNDLYKPFFGGYQEAFRESINYLNQP